MKIEHLPERYREQAREQLAVKGRVAPASPDVESDTGNAPVAEKKVEGLPTPCGIHFHSLRHRLADSDGLSGKACLDGIVHAGLLPDDKTEYVTEVRFSQEKTKGEEKTIIYIYKAESETGTQSTLELI